MRAVSWTGSKEGVQLKCISPAGTYGFDASLAHPPGGSWANESHEAIQCVVKVVRRKKTDYLKLSAALWGSHSTQANFQLSGADAGCTAIRSLVVVVIIVAATKSSLSTYIVCFWHFIQSIFLSTVLALVLSILEWVWIDKSVWKIGTAQ